MEKLTINLPPIEIARMDILIEAGFYSNRAEFIRASIRERLDSHQDFISKKLGQITQSTEETKGRKMYSGMGIIVLDKKEFENAIRQGTMINIHIVGMLKLTKDVTPNLVEKAVDSVKVYGVVRASQKVKEALQSKMERG